MRPESAITLALFSPGVSLTTVEVATRLNIGDGTALVRLAKLTRENRLQKRRVAQRGNVYALPGDESLENVDRGGWWTNERCDQLTRLRGQGLSVAQIRDRMGAPTIGSVSARLNRMSVKRVDATAPTEWTDEMVARVRELHAEGKNDREIGEAMGLTQDSVRAKRKRLRLPAVAVLRRERAARSPRVPRSPRQIPFRASTPDTAAKPQPPATDAFAPIDAVHRPWTTRKLGECKWPIDMPEGEEMHSCCRPVERAGYCAAHVRKAFVPSTYVAKLRDPAPRRRA